MWFKIRVSRMINSSSMHAMPEFDVEVWASNKADAMIKVRREFGQQWHLRVL